MSTKVPLLKLILQELCYRFFISVYSFCKTKGYYYWKHKFGWLCVRPPDCCKLAKNRKYDNDVTILRYGVIVKFWHCFVSLVTFSYWSKFHVNIITGHGIKTIFFYKGLTRNWEIGNNPIWVLPNIWRLGQVMDTKFGTNLSNRLLLNAAKFQSYSLYRFWVIKGKPTWSFGNSWGNSYIYQVYYQQSCFASFVVKRKFAKTSKSLKILWQGLYFKFVCTFYVFINSSIH